MNPSTAYNLRFSDQNQKMKKQQQQLSRNGNRGQISKTSIQQQQQQQPKRKQSFSNQNQQQKNTIKLLNAKRDAANMNGNSQSQKLKANSTINGMNNHGSNNNNSGQYMKSHNVQNSLNLGIYQNKNNNNNDKNQQYRPHSNNNKLGTMTNNFTLSNNIQPQSNKTINGQISNLMRGKFQSTQNIKAQSIEFNNQFKNGQQQSNNNNHHSQDDMKKVLSDLRLPKLKYEQQMQQKQILLQQQKLRNQKEKRNATPSHSKNNISNSNEQGQLSYNSFHQKIMQNNNGNNSNNNNQQQQENNGNKYQFKNIQQSHNNLKNSQIYKKIQNNQQNLYNGQSSNNNRDGNQQQNNNEYQINNNHGNNNDQKLRNGYNINSHTNYHSNNNNNQEANSYAVNQQIKQQQQQQQQQNGQNTLVNSSINNFINNNRKILQSPEQSKNKMVNSRRKNSENQVNGNSENQQNNMSGNNNTAFQNTYKLSGTYQQANMQKDLKKKRIGSKTQDNQHKSYSINNMSQRLQQQSHNNTHTNNIINNNYGQKSSTPSHAKNKKPVTHNPIVQAQSIDQILGLKNILGCFGSKTQAGVNAKGPKQNQDSMITYPNFLSSESIHLFVALDGHGLHGQKVSNFVKKILPSRVEMALLRDYQQLNDEKYVRNSLRIAFFQISKHLLESNIDCTFSGTTCVLVLIIGKNIYCANIGDSRAVLGYNDSNDLIQPKALSRDHKPDDPIEQDRIIKSGGRVDTYHDIDGSPIGPARVWLLDRDLPGLAMARSFGDLVAVSAGVICDPEITVHHFDDKNDKMIVMGSDGIWEFVENNDAIDIAMPYYQKMKPDIASIKIVNVSLNLWKQNDDVIDDITGIIIYFQESNSGNTNRNDTSNINDKSQGQINGSNVYQQQQHQQQQKQV